MTKSALLAFTRGLARELGPQAITVNLVQPGPIDTDQNPADGAWADGGDVALGDLERQLDGEDIAALVGAWNERSDAHAHVMAADPISGCARANSTRRGA